MEKKKVEKEIADDLSNVLSCSKKYVPIDLIADMLSRLTTIKSIGRFIFGEKKKEEKQIADDLNNAALSLSKRHVPIDLIAEILSTLPIKSIGRIMFASKSWRDIVTSGRFSFAYAQNNPFYTFFGTSSVDSRGFYTSYVVEVAGDYVRANFRTRYCFRTNFRTRVLDGLSCILLVGSCNGLLCLVERRFGFDIIIILNPITSETTRINSSNHNGRRSEVHYRFGYSPSTNEYKVFRCFRTVPNVIGFHDRYAILTVGVDKRWRKLSPELFPNYMRHGIVRMVPSCKGTFYWLAGDENHDDDNFVLAFDIAEENTRRIPIPRADQRPLRLLVSNDPLCLYYRKDQANIIWKMEDDGDRWSQIAVPNFPLEPHEKNDYNVESIASTKCGGILFWIKRSEVLGLYSRKPNKYNAIQFLHDSMCEFTPSFCSINEIMSKPSKYMRSYFIRQISGGT